MAVDVGDETRAELARAREVLRSRLEGYRMPPRVSWVKEEAAHVTLRFLGETPEDVAKTVQEALAGGVGVPPFDVRWDRIGTFPSGRRPRVIWMGPSTGVDAMTVLAQQVNERLDAIVGPGESRPFTPHLTIGRVKDGGRDVDWQQALAAVRLAPTTSRVDHLTLYQSRTSPKGATYTALCTVVMGVAQGSSPATSRGEPQN